MNYAQLDAEQYCIGISTLSAEVDYPNMIAVDSPNSDYINRKYDIENKKWTDEYREVEPVAQESQDEIWRNQIEAGMAQIAMQTAMNTLLQGGV